MRVESIVIPAMRAVVHRPWLSRLVFARDPWGNPYRPEAIADPSETVARMWADGQPVVHRALWGRWFVLGYDECQIMANHPAASASRDIASLLDEVRPYKGLRTETKDFFRSWILLRDPPDHTRLRRLISRPFTPRRIAGLTAQIESVVVELLDAVDGRPTIEMVTAFNRPFPIRIIASMIGFPPERREWAGDVVARMSTFIDPMTTFDIATIDRAVEEFGEVVLELAEERRHRPADDLLTALVEADEEGELLNEQELVANVGLLIFAGHDTTSNMLGNALVALAAHPDQRAMVRNRPELWPNAVEELLRYDPTVVSLPRRTTEEIDLGSAVIPAGAAVILDLAAANRDPRRWDAPDRLRLDRPDPRPLSFGHGLHHCLGHALARTELQVALRALVDRLGDFTIEPDGVDWRISSMLRGPTRLELRRG